MREPPPPPRAPAQNFVCTILESQYIDSPGGGGEHAQITALLERLNLFFTFLFAAELALNAFSNWLRPFATNGWSLLDSFVVVTSLVSTVVSNQPTSIVRVLRALRVIRIFGRVKSLRKIMTALTMALLPVLNVFLILFLLIAIGPPPSPPLPPSTPAAPAPLAQAPSQPFPGVTPRRTPYPRRPAESPAGLREKPPARPQIHTLCASARSGGGEPRPPPSRRVHRKAPQGRKTVQSESVAGKPLGARPAGPGVPPCPYRTVRRRHAAPASSIRLARRPGPASAIDRDGTRPRPGSPARRRRHPAARTRPAGPRRQASSAPPPPGRPGRAPARRSSWSGDRRTPMC